MLDEEFAAAAPLPGPGAVTAVAATGGRIARYVLSSVEPAENLVVRWQTDDWPDR